MKITSILMDLLLTATASAQSRIWMVPGTEGVSYTKPTWVSTQAGAWIYAIDVFQQKLVRIDPLTGAKTDVVAPEAFALPGGNGGNPIEFVVDRDGLATFSVVSGRTVRLVQVQDGRARTLFSGEVAANLQHLVQGPDGSIYFVDTKAKRIMALTPTPGHRGEFTAMRLAGQASGPPAGVHGPQDDPLAAPIEPMGLAILRDGSILFSDRNSGQIRMLVRDVDQKTGRVKWRLADLPDAFAANGGQWAPGLIVPAGPNKFHVLGSDGAQGMTRPPIYTYSLEGEGAAARWQRAPFAGENDSRRAEMADGKPAAEANCFGLGSIGAVPGGGLLVSNIMWHGIYYIGPPENDGALYQLLVDAKKHAEAGENQKVAAIIRTLRDRLRLAPPLHGYETDDLPHALWQVIDSYLPDHVGPFHASNALRVLKGTLGGNLDRFLKPE